MYPPSRFWLPGSHAKATWTPTTLATDAYLPLLPASLCSKRFTRVTPLRAHDNVPVPPPFCRWGRRRTGNLPKSGAARAQRKPSGRRADASCRDTVTLPTHTVMGLCPRQCPEHPNKTRCCTPPPLDSRGQGHRQVLVHGPGRTLLKRRMLILELRQKLEELSCLFAV